MRGGLFLSLITKENHYTVKDYMIKVINSKLYDLWSKKQIRDIEAYYEGYSDAGDEIDNFYCSYRDTRDRMMAIKNMKANKGLLRPSTLKHGKS